MVYNYNGMVKRVVCNHLLCNNTVTAVIGDCTYCKQRFCMWHRLPEAHECTAIDMCKTIAFERNASKLISGKCVGTTVFKLV